MISKVLALCAAKFTQSADCGLIVDMDTGSVLQTFPASIDTQSFDQFGEDFVVLHHQSYKDSQHSSVELFVPGANTPYAALPEADELEFPSALVTDQDHLVVACNGRDFRGLLVIYELQSGALPKLVRRISLETDQARPTGLAICGDCVFLASYSGQKIWSFDLISGASQLVLDVSMFGQTTPMGLAVTDDLIYVLGHVDSSLVLYNRKYGLPIQIIRDGLDYPWSLLVRDDEIIVANRGRKSSGVFTSSIAYFDTEGVLQDSCQLEGVTVLRP